MPGPWLLLATALTLTLTLTGVPGGRAQPEVDPQDAEFAAEYPTLMDLLRLLQQLRVGQGNRESGERRV